MKILFVESGLERIYRGVERYTINLVLALAKMKEEIIVVSRYKPRVFESYTNITWLPSAMIPRELLIYWKRPFEEISSGIEVLSHTLSSLPKILKIDFDVAILNHYSDGYFLPLVRSLKKHKKIKIIYVIHSVPRMLSLPFYLPALFANKVVCVSNFVKRKLLEILPVKNSTVIYNGVDTTFFAPKLQKKENTVLYVGALLKKKGIFTLLKVAKDLKNIKFWIVGDGPERKRVEYFVKRYKNLRAFFKVSDEKLVNLYSLATLTVVPSEYPEALPLVPLESFSCGTPVIASNIGGLGEIVKKLGGITFTPRNIESLKSKINYLLENDNERRKIAIRGRKKVKKFFDWKIIAEKYIREIRNANYESL